MKDLIPVGLTRKEIETLIYSLRLAAINCHESNEAEVTTVFRRIQAIAVAYGIKP